MTMTKCWCGCALMQGPHPDYKQCEDCGTLVASEQPNAATLKQRYGLQSYWHDNMHAVKQPPIEQRAVNDLNDRIPYWFKSVRDYHPLAKSVFEIGCAHGGFLRYCLDHGFTTAHGCEVDPATCAWAREHFRLPVVIPGLFPVAWPASYDVMCGFDVLEHIGDPVAAVVAMRRMLSAGGILVLQSPWYRDEGAKWPQFNAREHLFMFTEAALVKLMCNHHLELVSFKQGLFSYDWIAVARCE